MMRFANKSDIDHGTNKKFKIPVLIQISYTYNTHNNIVNSFGLFESVSDCLSKNYLSNA